MDFDKLRETLEKRGYDSDQIECAVETVKGFESFLKSGNKNPDDKQALAQYCKTLVDNGKNTWFNLSSLATYGRLLGSTELTVNVIEMLDGAEAIWNLRDVLDKNLGTTEADKYFENVRMLEIGESNEARPAEMGKIISRMQDNLGQEKTASLICNCLRNLEDSWYAEELKLFEECGRDIPKFIKAKGDHFLADLEAMKNEGRLYFSQPITDEVIEFVKANPEIHYGVLDGNYYYDMKIPHQAAKMLSETDPIKRRYHYCHCPWVKESLKEGKSSVPPVFCNCSAGFHKRMWEVLLGHPVKCEVLESVLKGDDRCRFRVSIGDKND